ncbi:GNAT family N-acetyltransferase [Priestia endophytica]|uniref:GNAT family N-acetyltransferase n=1 Tax=Priestia endophytica TaxID=135735 RepID=UPI003D2CF796
MKMPRETNRLYFKAISEKYQPILETFMKCGLLPFVEKNQGVEKLITTIRQQYRSFKIGLWAVHRKKDDEVIGIAGLMLNKGENGIVIELGYAIHPHYQNQGYAKEAAKEVCLFGFNTHRFPKIVAFVPPTNKRSISVLKRLNFDFKEEIMNEIPFYSYEATSNLEKR